MVRRAGLLLMGGGAANNKGRGRPTTSARKVMRSAVAAFLDGYHCFSPVAAALALPFSAAVLATHAAALSMSSSSSSPASVVHAAVASAFRLAGLAATDSGSPLLSLLAAKLSQTLFVSAATLPFALTFLLLARACAAAILLRRPRERRRRTLPPTPLLPAVARAYGALLPTQLATLLLTVAAHAAALSLLSAAVSFAGLFGNSAASAAVTAAGAIAYCVLVAMATVVCSLALAVAAMEAQSSTGAMVAGHAAVARACVLVRGRVRAALALALPARLAMAAAEALFQLRVVRNVATSAGGATRSWAAPGVAGEALSIAYIHALCVVLDIIVGCMFYTSCCKTTDDDNDDHKPRELEPEDKP
ncbi:uncharacterized protein LOC100833751 [Brachypodium distachyon]|uniref:Uncharacterized protein n=1 Tax=Brachypodium distachyon TaxID=15368 RepID=I1IH72_BRADI|nr:uncharacterized protein LOC100833751 [Brachypodium distachyon]XP_024319183.1 uncharacterized protein LOC100833751 [Brachypodium distachyon]KQJ86170.1 hypothetical protein BRADI_4g03730v3 [Brachypodium distachyon]|eukprot:XP_014758398.1 uncharacterized protein LOC100833751 [Brachypodium distachyon]